MLHWFVLLAIACSTAAITAFEEGETGTAAGHAATGATDYTGDD